MNSRDTLAQLQANMQAGDELMVRALQELGDHVDLLEEMEAVFRLRSVAMTAATSFIVETKALLAEARGDARKVCQ